MAQPSENSRGGRNKRKKTPGSSLIGGMPGIKFMQSPPKTNNIGKGTGIRRSIMPSATTASSNPSVRWTISINFFAFRVSIFKL
jgi:hypothetical protein